MEHKELYAAVDDHIKEYEHSTITISDDIEFSMRKTVRQITHYILSKYMDPNEEGRFRNIGNSIVNIEWRAKNIDRKSIEAHATDSDHVFSLLVNKEVQQWMKVNNFGKTIDDYQRKKSQYGSVLLKKTETKDKLIIDVTQWENVYVDPSDIAGGMKVEVDNWSILKLKKKRGTWDDESIDDLIELASKERGKGRRIKIYDIEGEFEACDVEGTDSEEIKLYNIIVGEVAGKKHTLYTTDPKESRFKHFKRLEVENRDFGMGVWEECFETQIATNEAELDEHDAMTIAGKVVVKTNKKDAPSLLTIRNGEVVDLNEGEFFDTVQLTPAALPKYQQRIDSWFINLQRQMSAHPGISGEEPKASTPGISLELQAAQAGSIFNKFRDYDGYDILEVLNDWVLPFIVKQIEKEHELTAAYSPVELKLIDSAMREYHIEQSKKSIILAGDVPPPELDAILGNAVDTQLAKQGSKRTLKIDKGYFTLERIQKKVRFDITDEMSDDQRRINALAAALAQLPPGAPERAPLVAEMMEIGGISAATFPTSSPTDGQGQAPKPAQSRVNNVLPDGQQK